MNPLQHKILIKKELTKFYCDVYQKINYKKLSKNHNFDLFFDYMNDDKIIEVRNSMHSLNPIVQAIKNDDLELLKKILTNSQFDINKKLPKSSFELHSLLDDANMIEYAAFFGSINCFNYLQSYSKKIDFIKHLEYAIAGGNIELIKQIKAKLNGVDLSNNTNLLYNAILFMKNNLIFSIIHSFNIQIDAEAYIKCIYSSNYEAFFILRNLDLSNSINSFGYIGSTPIDIAAFEGSYFFFKFLINEPGIDAMKLNDYGKTILHSAARSDKIDIVRYIIKHNLIDPDFKGEFGRSSIELAQYYNHRDILKFLLKH